MAVSKEFVKNKGSGKSIFKRIILEKLVDKIIDKFFDFFKKNSQYILSSSSLLGFVAKGNFSLIEILLLVMIIALLLVLLVLILIILELRKMLDIHKKKDEILKK